MGYVTDWLGHLMVVCGVPLVLVGVIYMLWQVIVSLSAARYEMEERNHRRCIELQRSELIYPRDGMYPLPRTLIMQGELPKAHLGLSLAYLDSTRTHPETINNHSVEQLTGKAPVQIEAMASASIPAWLQLVDDGSITGDPDKILLGHTDNGDPLYRGWKQLYSCIVGGTSGAGKSSTMRNILAQAVMGNCRFSLIDPHLGSDESISTSLQAMASTMLMPTAQEDEAVLTVLEWFRNEFQRRKKSGDKGPPIMLVVDEATSLLRRSDVSGELATALIEIAQEGRKYGIFALVACQTLTVASMGKDTSLRDSFASAFVHRCSLNHARALLQGIDEAKQCKTLADGRCVYYQASGDVDIIQVPYVSKPDVDQMFGGASKNLSELETRVRDALVRQESLTSIVSEVYGVTTKGSSYQNAVKDIRRITAELLG